MAEKTKTEPKAVEAKAEKNKESAKEKVEETPKEVPQTPEYKAYEKAAEKAKPVVALIRQGKIAVKKEGKQLKEGQRWATKEEEDALRAIVETKDAAFATKNYRLSVSIDVRDFLVDPSQTLEKEDLRELRRRYKSMVVEDFTHISELAKKSGKTELGLGAKKAEDKAEKKRLHDLRLKAKITERLGAKADKKARIEGINAQIELLKSQAKKIRKEELPTA